MDWIELHTSIREHRKTCILEDTLKIERYAAVGLVATLWAWAFDNASNGDLSGFPVSSIASACYWKKKPTALISALQTAGFLDDDMHIHNWEAYCTYAIERANKSREQTRLRVQKTRANKKNVTHTSVQKKSVAGLIHEV